jgi:hypothetical protein
MWFQETHYQEPQSFAQRRGPCEVLESGMPTSRLRACVCCVRWPHPAQGGHHIRPPRYIRQERRMPRSSDVTCIVCTITTTTPASRWRNENCHSRLSPSSCCPIERRVWTTLQGGLWYFVRIRPVFPFVVPLLHVSSNIGCLRYCFISVIQKL